MQATLPPDPLGLWSLASPPQMQQEEPTFSFSAGQGVSASGHPQYTGTSGLSGGGPASL